MLGIVGKKSLEQRGRRQMLLVFMILILIRRLIDLTFIYSFVFYFIYLTQFSHIIIIY